MKIKVENVRNNCFWTLTLSWAGLRKEKQVSVTITLCWFLPAGTFQTKVQGEGKQAQYDNLTELK